MLIRDFKRDKLNVQIHSSRLEMGAASAALAASVIRSALEKAGRAAVIFACAPSQNEFLACLRAAPGIDWTRVVAFHLDEYAGLGADHPASFRRFLRERLIGHVPIGRFHELQGDAADLEAECSRYARLLAGERPVLVVLGVGENGHLAFIDPPVCDFADPRDVRTVDLDKVCACSRCTMGHLRAWKMFRRARFRSPSRSSCVRPPPWSRSRAR